MELTKEYKKKRWEGAFTSGSHLPKNMRRATMALFWEYRHNTRAKERGITPLFTLKPYDHDDCLSFPLMYFQCNSEYEFAMVVLGDWKHWERLKATPWFPKYLNQWQEEKERRDEAFAKGKIMELAENGNLSACRLLAEGKLNKEHKAKPKEEDPTPGDSPETSVEDNWLDRALKRVESER